jgi:hypothetical protein
MKTYARIETGTVAELLLTEANPADLFHPALRWVEVTQAAVAVGWTEGPAGLTPPQVQEPVLAPMPTLAELHARLADLAAQVAALTPR